MGIGYNGWEIKWNEISYGLGQDLLKVQIM